MPDLDLPVPHDDNGVWGQKLNDAIDVLNDAVEAAASDATSAVSTAGAAASDAADALTSAASAVSTAGDAVTSVAAVVPRTETRAVGQDELVVNVKDYGAVGDGVANDTTAIQAAIDAAVGEVLLPEGDYLLGSGTTLSVPAGVSLVGRGPGVTRILRGGSGGDLVDLSGGSVGDTVTTLTADAAVGASSLTVASTAGIVAGQWLLLVDDRPPDPDKPTRPGGEIVRVKSITSGTVLLLETTSPTAAAPARGVGGTFDDAAMDGIGSYLTTENARLVEITLAEGASVRSLSLINPTPGSANGVGISAGATLGVTIDNVEIAGIDGTGIAMGHAVGAFVTRCHIHDLVDDPDEGRYGYGINIAGGASDIVISDCLFERMRHAVTTDGHVNGGIPRRITVSSCRAHQTHHASFDTHGAAMDMTFSDCVSVDSAQYGFSVRGRGITFRGCEAIRPDAYGFNVATTPARRIVIDSCTVRDGNSAGVRVGGDGIVDVYISNLFVDGCAGNGVLLGYGNTRQVVTNSRFFNVGQGASPPYYGVSFATGTLGAVDAPNTLIAGNLFVQNKTYSVSTAYNGAVKIPHSSLVSVVVGGNRVVGIYGGSSGFLQDDGTTTLLFDNMRMDGTTGGYATIPNSTTTSLTSLTSVVNKSKRRGVSVYNSTTGKPVWAAGDGAAAVWVDATGATVHTPV